MKRFFVGVAVALAALALAAPASATQVDVAITCEQVTFTYTSFPPELQSSSVETVTVNGATVHDDTFTFTGPSGTSVVPLTGVGTATIVASFAWTSPFNQGGDSEEASVECGGGTTGGDTTGGDTTGGDTTGGDTTGGDTTGGGTTGGGTTGTGGAIGNTTGGSGETSGELPFTGLPILIPILLAAGLLASGGLLLRRKRDDAS